VSRINPSLKKPVLCDFMMLWVLHLAKEEQWLSCGNSPKLYAEGHRTKNV
jgi:hypothetical protein